MKTIILNKITGVMLCVVVLLLFLSSIAYAADPSLFLPTAERAYGEKLFAAAYRNALNGKIEASEQKLEEALRYDPYMVSYYLLKGYCASLAGDYDKAAVDIGLYLEVKAKDSFARGFLKEVERRKAFIDDGLSGGITSKAEQSVPGDFRDRFGVGTFRWPILFSMPGRPAELGDVLAMCDTSDERVWIQKRHEGKWSKYCSASLKGRIIRAIPVSGDSVVMVFADGKYSVRTFGKKGFTELLNGQVGDGYVSDASFPGAGLLAVSERIPGKVHVVEMTTGKEKYSWRPLSRSFEPVSLASLGPLLAVADRGGNRVFVLDMHSGKKIAEFPVSGPLRSVEWLSSEKLVALTEDGRLFSISMKNNEVSSIGKSIPEAWFLFKSDSGRVVVADTRLYRYNIVNVNTNKGFLALKYPKSMWEEESNSHYWTVEARLIRPLNAVVDNDRIFQSILGGSIAEVQVLDAPKCTKLLEPTELPSPRDENFTGGSTKQLLLRPGNLPRDPKFLAAFAGYAFSNGVVVHLLADKELPDLHQLRFSEITGGKLILSENQKQDLKASCTYNLRMNLAPALELPGNPGSSGLFIRARMGIMALEGRIPFWNAFLN